jgi:hypothetical protein
VLNDAGGFENGQVQFRDLIKQGALTRINRVLNPLHSEIEIDVDDDDDDEEDPDCSGIEAEDHQLEDDKKQLTLSLSHAGGLMITPVDVDSSTDSPVSTPPDNLFDLASFQGAGGFTRHWDLCSSTPFLRSEFAEQIITFDDPHSLSLKAAWVKESEILGVNIFDVHGDTDDWDLVDSIRKGLGII